MMDARFLTVYRGLRRHPGMYVRTGSFNEVVSFLYGLDSDDAVLGRFSMWLQSKEKYGPELGWPGWVLHYALGREADTPHTDEESDVALDALFSLMDNFIAEDGEMKSVSGDATMWSPVEETGTIDMVRRMPPNRQYPNGYVRFFNRNGEAVDLAGAVADRRSTHFAIQPDGSYPVPEGWEDPGRS